MNGRRVRGHSPRWWHALLAVAVVVTAALALSSSGDHPAVPFHRAFMVTGSGLTLRATRAGTGPTVVLLHGFGESLLSWRGTFDRLAADADVIALDLPGFGLSDKPVTGYGNERMAAAVLGALDALGVQHAVIVGHSMGGAVAVTLALAAPQRVSGLVLVSPAVSGASWGLRPPGTEGVADDWMRRAIARYERLRPRFTAPHDPNWLGEDSAALAYTPADDPAYDVALQSVLREFDFDFLTPERAARLTLPMLVIWGEFDQVIPRAIGARIVASVSSARLVIVPRSLHRPHVERPDAVAALIAGFLSQLETR